MEKRNIHRVKQYIKKQNILNKIQSILNQLIKYFKQAK